MRVCSSAGRAAVSKAAGRGFESLRTRLSETIPTVVNKMQRTNTKALQKMDEKKSRSTTSSKKFEGRKVIDFVGNVKQELKKVEWTSKDELKSYTKIVLVSTLFFGMFVYFIDLIIQGLLGGINMLVKFFIG